MTRRMLFFIWLLLPGLPGAAASSLASESPVRKLYSKVILNGMALSAEAQEGKPYVSLEAAERAWGPFHAPPALVIHAPSGDLVSPDVFSGLARFRETADGVLVISPFISVSVSAPEGRLRIESTAGLPSPRVSLREERTPHRLIVQVFGALKDPSGPVQSGHSLFPEVTAEQEALFPDKVVVTARLHDAANYDLAFLGRALQFTFFLFGDMTVTRQDGRSVITVPTVPEVKPFVFTLAAPDRLVVDLPGFVNRRKMPVDVDSAGIQRMICGYLETLPLSSTRCVVELTRPLTYVTKSKDDTFVVTLEDSSLYPRTIVLDAAHGGSDRGASVKGLPPEKDIALGLVRHLKAELERRGAAVVLTRGDDRTLGASERLKIANAARSADALLSIQLGAAKGRAAETSRGIAVSFATSASSNLAHALYDSMINLLKMNGRGVKKTPSLWFRRVRPPATLLTCGYLSQPEEGRWVADDSHWPPLAVAIANGLEAYFDSQKSPGQTPPLE